MDWPIVGGRLLRIGCGALLPGAGPLFSARRGRPLPHRGVRAPARHTFGHVHRRRRHAGEGTPS
eukprot:427835-Pyramimonas_sp.AAC.1